MEKLYKKHPIPTGILTALILYALFYLAEWLLWKYTPLTHGDSWHFIDFGIRMITGFAGLWVLRCIYGNDLKSIFSGHIGKKAWLFMLVFPVYFIICLCELFTAKELTGARTVSFFISWLTQIGSGFFEEILSRGLLLCGFLYRPQTDGISYKKTTGGRLLIVFTSGIVFGLLHLCNVIYGNDIIDCLWWGLDTLIWGAFVAGIYMMTSNLWVVISLHTIWDIICKIPGYFIKEIGNEAMYSFLENTEYVFNYGIFLILAILICVFYREKEV